MRKIGVVTVGRSDYGIYLPILKQIKADPDLELFLIVSGMHLAPEFGQTVDTITADGFEIDARVEMMVSSDSPEGIAKSMGMGLLGFSQLFAQSPPDLLLILGDRYEMYSAGLAALPFRFPIAHIHGGELTLGAIDDTLRHSLTKLSHLHFVSTAEYGRRVAQLGEEEWRVTVSGAPSLDNFRNVELLDARAFATRYGINLSPAPLLVTYHPVTLEYEQTDHQVDELLTALGLAELPVVFTAANADTYGRRINSKIKTFVEDRKDAWLVENLGTQGYFSLMKLSAAMVGNSSSGIIEAASFQLPVVNIGNRQAGRARAANVIDVGYGHREILQAIDKARQSQFKDGLQTLKNPYGNGTAAGKIVETIKSVKLDTRLKFKKFKDLF